MAGLYLQERGHKKASLQVVVPFIRTTTIIGKMKHISGLAIPSLDAQVSPTLLIGDIKDSISVY